MSSVCHHSLSPNESLATQNRSLDSHKAYIIKLFWVTGALRCFWSKNIKLLNLRPLRKAVVSFKCLSIRKKRLCKLPTSYINIYFCTCYQTFPNSLEWGKSTYDDLWMFKSFFSLISCSKLKACLFSVRNVEWAYTVCSVISYYYKQITVSCTGVQ